MELIMPKTPDLFENVDVDFFKNYLNHYYVAFTAKMHEHVNGTTELHTKKVKLSYWELLICAIQSD